MFAFDKFQFGELLPRGSAAFLGVHLYLCGNISGPWLHLYS